MKSALVNIEQYIVRPRANRRGIANKTSKKKSFFEVAKNHIIKTGKPKENISLKIDEILYGKK
jgi:uncharacterized membrane-anchored protein